MPQLRQKQATNFAKIISNMPRILLRLSLSQKPKKLLSKVDKFGINFKLCSMAIISSTPSTFSFIRLAARPPKTSALVLVNFYPQGRRALRLLKPKIEGWFQNRPKIPNVNECKILLMEPINLSQTPPW